MHEVVFDRSDHSLVLAAGAFINMPPESYSSVKGSTQILQPRVTDNGHDLPAGTGYPYRPRERQAHSNAGIPFQNTPPCRASPYALATQNCPAALHALSQHIVHAALRCMEKHAPGRFYFTSCTNHGVKPSLKLALMVISMPLSLW